jgi:hypothetical protein
MAAGLARASAVVCSYHDTPSALKVLHLVQTHAPRVPVIVRTIDRRLRPRGAEGRRRHRGRARGDRGLADAGLARAGAGGRADAARDPLARDAREARYGLLRGFFHGADDVIIGPVLAYELNVGFIPIRKQGKLPYKRSPSRTSSNTVRRPSRFTRMPAGRATAS